jgi:hypothetical protein
MAQVITGFPNQVSRELFMPTSNAIGSTSLTVGETLTKLAVDPQAGLSPADDPRASE